MSEAIPPPPTETGSATVRNGGYLLMLALALPAQLLSIAGIAGGVAQPHIAQGFHATDIGWFNLAAPLVSLFFLPFAVKLGDVHGKRRVRSGPRRHDAPRRTPLRRDSKRVHVAPTASADDRGRDERTLHPARPDQGQLVERVRELAPVLAANVAKGEQDRHVVEESIQALTDAGLFRLAVPKRSGGYETASKVGRHRVALAGLESPMTTAARSTVPGAE